MNKLNAFFKVGLIGLIVTAVCQFSWPYLQVNLKFESIPPILYPICLALIVIGVGMMLKVEKQPLDD